MFERMRSNLAGRLAALIGRFDRIDSRAIKWQDEFDLGTRLGLGSSPSLATAIEISTKANEQAELCGEALDLLLDKRAFPLTFRGAVARAERFADQCEAILDQFDQGAEAGREAFRKRIGDTDAISSERLAELAQLASQLSEADAAMSLKLKMQSVETKKMQNSARNP